MRKIGLEISSVVVTLIFVTVLCSPFGNNGGIEDNWFRLIPISIGILLVTALALFAFLSSKKKLSILFPDVLFCMFIFYYASRYDYELQLCNWKIVNALLLLGLWLAARVILSCMAIKWQVLQGGVVFIGVMLTVWGWLQLYGVLPSNHQRFALTGPFHNPGPYAGYMAVIFPICLHSLLLSQGKWRYLWWLVLFVMACILPATLSRSSWLALGGSCIWVLGMHYGCWKVTKRYVKKHLLVLTGVIPLLLCLSYFLFFQFKSGSVHGRLFIWKNTCKVAVHHLLWGTGVGSFPYQYGQEQSAYFKSGTYTELEENVAGAPLYAFNEYLQMQVEGGTVLFVLFGMLAVSCLRRGVASRKYGFCAGVISLLLFSVSSYPLQLIPFPLLGVLMLAVCVSNMSEEERSRCHGCVMITVLSVGLLINVFTSYSLYKTRHLADVLNYTSYFHSNGLLEDSEEEFRRAYPVLKHNPDFLIEYAKCLADMKQVNEAVDMLERAKLVCCHPTIWNVQGKIYQSQDDFLNAEKCFKESISLLPGRIYPYYLLAKLYSEPNFYHKDKLLEMINIVLTKREKVSSSLVDEMRVEMQELLEETLRR